MEMGDGVANYPHRTRIDRRRRRTCIRHLLGYLGPIEAEGGASSTVLRGGRGDGLAAR
jgi:hypothetical protein